jgi:hypothetical protein
MDTSSTKCAVLLKTADQYDIWKARVSDACWCATLKDVFTVSDEECKASIAALEAKDQKDKHLHEWVGKCWTVVTASLHDDVYRKVNHVSRGLIKSLLTEISHTLVVSNLEEVGPLRLELYGGTMQKDCGCELQTWINFIVERAQKLNFLKKAVEETELVTLFLKGLHPVFNQLQVYFAIPGSTPKTFEGAVAITRKFAANPTVAADLAKLRSNGMSQTMFSLTTAQGAPSQQGVFAPSQSYSQAPAHADMAPGAIRSYYDSCCRAATCFKHVCWWNAAKVQLLFQTCSH